MAHLKQECRECCKDCVYLSYYDDRQSSWFYCGFLGNAYDSVANKNVDHRITTVFEKREGDIIPRFYDVFASPFCTRSVSLEKLVNVVECNLKGDFRDAVIFALRKTK